MAVGQGGGSRTERWVRVLECPVCGKDGAVGVPRKSQGKHCTRGLRLKGEKVLNPEG